MSPRILAVLALLSIALIPGPAGAAAHSTQTASDARLANAPAERALAVSGVAPLLDQPAPMTVIGGTTADQALHAADADGDSITFSKAFGPSYMTVTTIASGRGTGTGNVHLAPTLADIGDANGSIVASDGVLQDTRPIVIHVTGPDRAPALAQPNPMSARAGETVDQALTATDPDGDPLVFTKAFGPTYMSVQTVEPGTGDAIGNARISPGASDAGSDSGAVDVSDGVLSDRKIFAITVEGNHAPTMNFIDNVFMSAGTVQDRTISANDADGDMLTFAKASGPTWVTVSTVSPGNGFAVGNIHLAPPPPLQGGFGAAASVSDGALTTQQSFTVFVSPPNSPPILSPLPDNIDVIQGSIVEQMVTATDPDGGFVSIYMSSGPGYMTVSSNSGFPASATIRLAPGAADVGTATASVSATDFTSTVTESFTITVLAGNFPPSCPATTFPVTSLATGFDPLGVAAADLDGDDNLDLLAADESDNKLSVHMGTGGGGFAPRVDFTTGFGPIGLAMGDFNRDGWLDVAVACSGSNAVSVLLGNGDGTFGAKRDFSVGSGPQAVVAADLTGDGRLDLAVANYYSGDVSILIGNGDGTFGVALSYFVGYGAIALAPGDFDGSGRPDLAVSVVDSGVVRLLLNNGSGGFTISVAISTGTPFDVVAADMNRDGKLDLAWTSQSNSVSVALGNGNGTFQPRRQFSAGASPFHLVVADLNGDALPDIATANNSGSSISLLLGDGLGALAPRTDVSVSFGPYGIASGDLDGDLRDDLVSTTAFASRLLILLNRGCAPARDRPPKVKAVSSLAATENSPVSVTVTASDPDGAAIASLTADVSGLPVGNNAAFTTNASHAAGTFTWTPTFNDARELPYIVTFTAVNALSGSATTRITVANVNRGPAASAGGPYTAFVNSPLTFDGGGSSDPDGDALAYSWIFGDGMTGVGPTPAHTYTALGLYGVAVTVSDGSLTGIATTTATVVGVFEARMFTEGGSRSIRLSAGKPEWCAEVEPIGRAYSNIAVNLATIVMKSQGTGSVSQIPAILGKTVVNADRDGNGVEEIAACFGKTDLRLLFSDVRGTQPVTVTIEGTLYTGGIFRASMDLLVTASGGGHTASIAPNPLNPEAVLTFVTERPGPVRVRLFDPSGRMVRSLLDDPYAPAGYHDVRIDGRDASGARLASGLYFYRIDSRDGRTVGKFSVLK